MQDYRSIFCSKLTRSVHLLSFSLVTRVFSIDSVEEFTQGFVPRALTYVVDCKQKYSLRQHLNDCVILAFFSYPYSFILEGIFSGCK